MKKQIKHIIRDVLLRENKFDIGDAFEFIAKKEGRRPPFEWMLMNRPDILEKEDLHINGKLELYNLKNLKELPEGMKVDQWMTIDNCPLLEGLPKNLQVDSTLTVRDCPRISNIPSDIKVGGSLIIIRCISFVELERNLSVGANMGFLECKSLKKLPEGLHVNGDLSLYGCDSLKTLPMGLVVKGVMSLKYTSPLYQRFRENADALKRHIEQDLGGSVGYIRIEWS